MVCDTDSGVDSTAGCGSSRPGDGGEGATRGEDSVHRRSGIGGEWGGDTGDGGERGGCLCGADASAVCERAVSCEGGGCCVAVGRRACCAVAWSGEVGGCCGTAEAYRLRKLSVEERYGEDGGDGGGKDDFCGGGKPAIAPVGSATGETFFGASGGVRWKTFQGGGGVARRGTCAVETGFHGGDGSRAAVTSGVSARPPADRRPGGHSTRTDFGAWGKFPRGLPGNR